MEASSADHMAAAARGVSSRRRGERYAMVAGHDSRDGLREPRQRRRRAHELAESKLRKLATPGG